MELAIQNVDCGVDLDGAQGSQRGLIAVSMILRKLYEFGAFAGNDHRLLQYADVFVEHVTHG